MSQDERDETGALLQRVSRDLTVIIVEHDMEFMRRYAESVTVLHQGQVLSEGSVTQVQADPKVQEVYLGTSVQAEGEQAELAAEVLSFIAAGPPEPGSVEPAVEEKVT